MPAIDRPLLLDIPTEFTTERCLIRAPRAGDGAAMTEAIHESHAELKQWMNWAVELKPVEENELIVRRGAARYGLYEDLWMLIFNRETGGFLGATGLHQINWHVPKSEIGYWLRTSETGKGYMTEVVKGLTAFAFEVCHMARVCIRVDVENQPSRAVAERAGYLLEGIMRHEMRLDIDDSLRDILLFSMTRAMWEGTSSLASMR